MAPAFALIGKLPAKHFLLGVEGKPGWQGTLYANEQPVPGLSSRIAAP